MKLRRLYTDKPRAFLPIEFGDGLSAVLAEIRVPANRLKDTHNLGKTTVAELIDFCLLKGKDPKFFLFKHPKAFREFAFYLEVELPRGGFLTIRRAVDPGSKIDLLRSVESTPDARRVPDDDWDHRDLSFDRAKLLLDGILELSVLAPWRFRKLVGYLIRSQKDYLDVFQLGKFSGKHEDWKPFVAHLLGMEAQPVIDLYAKRSELEEVSQRLATLTQEWGGSGEADPSLVDGLISVKRRSIEEKTAAAASLDFGAEDLRTSAELVEQTDVRIAALNEERYRLAQLETRIAQSLADRQIAFSPSQAEQLFAEAGIAFGEQLKRDFSQLIEFNRAITEERSAALIGQRKEAILRTAAIDDELEGLNAARAQSLSFLRESDALAKYKDLSLELTKLQAELATLEAQREAATRLLELRRERRSLDEDFNRLQTDVETELETISKDLFHNDLRRRQQSSAQASCRNARWLSAERSQRVRSRRNQCRCAKAPSTTQRFCPSPDPCATPRRAIWCGMPRARSSRRYLSWS